MHKRPRQADVAKLAGVSAATVSVILNNRLAGNVRISAETQARVFAAVETLGYVTDPVARSLAGGQNALLGIFTGMPLFGQQPPHSYSPYLAGIEQAAAAHGYNLLIFTNPNSAKSHRPIYQGNINRLRMADGAILLGVEEHKIEVQRLVAEHYPFVVIGQHEATDGAMANVAVDYISATAKIVTEMLSCGHRHIAYFGNAQHREQQRDCYTGYLTAHRQAGLHSLVTPAHYVEAQQLTPGLIEQTLDRGSTAFILECGADIVPAFLQASATLHKSVPADFSLAILGEQMTDFVAPYPVVSFTIPRQAMGQRAAEWLIELLHMSPTQPLRPETFACSYAAGNTITAPPVPTV